MDRVARAHYGALLEKEEAEPSDHKIFVALAGAGTGEAGVQILQELRRTGVAADIGAPDKSLKAQLRWADSWRAHYVIIVGAAELARRAVQLKNLKDGTQEEIPLADLEAVIRSKFSHSVPST